MMRSLWTAASGMIGQQFSIDTIAHNLSNVNTIGYKRGRANFEDLFYQTLRAPGTPSSINTQYPTPIEVGLGSVPAATHKMYTQGSPYQTEQKTDVAIMGEGFFRIILPDGTYAYTRDGSFKIDAAGNLVTSNGNYLLDPNIKFPKGFVNDTISISQEGRITVKVGGDDRLVPVGSQDGAIKLYRFVNPKGMKNMGGNLLQETVASGPSDEGTPTELGFGKVMQGFLEMSNVKMAEEMVDMIVAQRAYEFNSKAIQTSDSMLQTAVQLKRT